MKKLWQKDVGNNINILVEKYTVGDDYVFDQELMKYDLLATKAHVFGLGKIGVINSQEMSTLIFSLNELEKEYHLGNIRITVEDEDCHTVIENYLTLKLGEVGKKVHTGRSRNDQVLVALRLYMKNELQEIKKMSLNLAEEVIKYIKNYQEIPLPGYSHTQQAMLSSVGHYFAGFLESLLDDIEFLNLVFKHLDKNPLGSAAGFGVSIPLDRQYVTQKLGFAKLQINSLYCQNSRGKFESVYLEALTQVMSTLNKFATDMLFFTSYECGYFEVDNSLVTGSSIMPHKKNMDVMEIVRGKASMVVANQILVKELSKNLLSGYNRDFQLMKKPLFESTKIVAESLQVVELFLNGLKPQTAVIESKINPGIFMADYANKLVLEKGIAFRDAYQLAKEAKLETNLVENIKSKISEGAPGNLKLEYYDNWLKELSK